MVPDAGGIDPPSRYWPTNLTKGACQRESLSRLVQSLHLFFCVFCAFSRLFGFSLNLCAFAPLREILLRGRRCQPDEDYYPITAGIG